MLAGSGVECMPSEEYISRQQNVHRRHILVELDGVGSSMRFGEAGRMIQQKPKEEMYSSPSLKVNFKIWLGENDFGGGI